MRLFFALSAARGFVVMGADCVNAYANSPSPTQATYVRIDDAYANWYRSRHERELTVRWYYHPKAGALWEKNINKILDDLDIVYTYTSEVSTEVRSTERSSFCAGKLTTSPSLVPILLWRKVWTSSYNESSTVLMVLTFTSDASTSKPLANPTSHACSRFMAGTNLPRPRSQTPKLIEPLTASTAEELSTSVGPAEGSTEHRTLEKEIGFSYRHVLGELTYAYVVGRVDTSYAVTLLARYSSDRCHYLASKRLCKYLRRTID
jgi:hypothetical protein